MPKYVELEACLVANSYMVCGEKTQEKKEEKKEEDKEDE